MPGLTAAERSDCLTAPAPSVNSDKSNVLVRLLSDDPLRSDKFRRTADSASHPDIRAKLGVIKADVGIKDGLIVALVKACSNTQDGVTQNSDCRAQH